jgi:hypothetical protein
MRARLLGLCLTTAGCWPGQFDRLDRVAETSARDAGSDGDVAIDADLSDAEAVDAPWEPDPEEDAAADGPLDDASADAGGDEDACAPALDGGRELVIAGPVLELARLGYPASVRNRKLGPSAWLGAHRVWTFSETGLADGWIAPLDAPVNYPSAALDGETQPWLPGVDDAPDWRLADALTDAGTPQPLLTRAPQELGLAVTSIVKTSPDGSLGGLAFVRNFTRDLAATEVWVAEIDDGATLAMRGAEALFTAPEPLFALGGVRDGGYVKLFACKSQPGASADAPEFPCLVARAPVDLARDHAAYEAYGMDEHGVFHWSDNFSLATPVLYASDGELSVSWNEHLQKFVAIHSAYFSNDVVLHTAPSVEGPWTEGVKVTLAAPLAWPALYAREHPSLQQRCGRRLIISHWAATALADGGLPNAGDVVLGAIDIE